MTNFNERTNTLLYKNISLTLCYRKGWYWLCVRGELETRTGGYILTKVLLTIAALLSHLGLGCSTICHWEPKALCLPLALTSASYPQLTPNARTSSGTRLYNCLTSTCFRCSSAYLHRCISWLTARLRVNMLHNNRCLRFFSVCLLVYLCLFLNIFLYIFSCQYVNVYNGCISSFCLFYLLFLIGSHSTSSCCCLKPLPYFAQSAVPLKRLRRPRMSVLDMSLNNPIVRFQWYWSFGECRAPFHCHWSHVRRSCTR